MYFNLGFHLVSVLTSKSVKFKIFTPLFERTMDAHDWVHGTPLHKILTQVLYIYKLII